MTVTAWLKPVSASQYTSTAQNVSNALVADGAYATLQHYASIPAAMNLVFAQDAVPGGAVISLIEVRVTGYNAALADLSAVAYSSGASASFIDMTGVYGVRTGSNISLTAAQSAAALGYNHNKLTMRLSSSNGIEGNLHYIDLFEIRITYTAPAAPTVATINPAVGPYSGGTQVVIEGTGFYFDATVAIGGVACTGVTVNSATQITCTTGAHAGGAVDVVVTNGGGNGTLAGGFTYLNTVDANVRLVDAGSFAGDDKADTATAWPANAAEVEYGAANDLWGLSLTPAKVNAADFGAGIAATVGAAATARVQHMEMEVHYSVPGVSDPLTYLAVLKVAADRQTAYPAMYQLPRSGYSVATDPSLSRATSDASLWTSRVFEPARYLEKNYHSVEFWADISPSSAYAAGLQVWAYVDDGTAYQLFDFSGNVATLRSSGRQLLFFPRTDAARGKYVQLEFRVPALSGDAVATDARVRNVVLRFSYRPERTEQHTLPINLGRIPVAGHSTNEERRSPYKKLLKLISLAGPGKPPVQMRDQLGRTVYVFITDVTFEETSYKLGEDPSLMALVSYRQVEYE